MSSDSAGQNPVVLVQNPAVVIGPIFTGNSLNFLLMGTLLVQVYHYHTTFTKDRAHIIILVYGLLALDVIQTLVSMQVTWWYAIENWGNPEAFAQSPKSQAFLCLLGGLVSAIVQLFYSSRAWRLMNGTATRIIVILIVLVSLSQCLSAVITSAIWIENATPDNLVKLHPGFAVWLAGSFASDVLICACMLYILKDARRRSGYVNTQRLITRLIYNSIGTGCVTAVCAGVDLVLFLCFSNADYHFTPALILGKLYTNSLMVTINSRKRIASSGSDLPGHTQNSFPLQIHVSQHTRQKVDNEHDLQHPSRAGTVKGQKSPKHAVQLYPTWLEENDSTDHGARQPPTGIKFFALRDSKDVASEIAEEIIESQSTRRHSSS